MLVWGARTPYPSSLKKPTISCAVCCVAGILNHNFPLKGLGSFIVFHPDTVFSAPSSCFIATNHWLVCLLQPHSLYPMHRPRVLPSPHLHLNSYTECFFGGEGVSLTQVGVIWEEGASVKESSPIRLAHGQVYIGGCSPRRVGGTIPGQMDLG